MRSDRLPGSKSTRKSSPWHFHFSQPLRPLGWASLLILGTLGNLAADDPLNTPGAISSAPVTDNSPPPANSTGNAQTPTSQQSPSNLPNSPQLPDNTQTTVNGPPQYTPLLPSQGGNPYSPFSPYATDYQSPQVTAPSLYNTGTTDLSQVGTNTALSQVFGNESAAGFLSEPDIGYSYPPIERIQLGPIDMKAAGIVTIVADDNLRPGDNGNGANGTGTQSKQSDVSYNLTPALLFEHGNREGQRGYASLVYAPTISRYLHYSAQNSDNQNVALNLRYPFQRLSLDATETYAQVTGFNEDLNARTTETSNLATFGGSYDIDDKLQFTSHIQNVISSYSAPGGGNNGQATSVAGAGQGDTTSSINSSLAYHLSDKMSLVGSTNFGIDKPKGEKQQTFEQVLMGVNYQPTEKISMNAQAGAEFRQGIQNDFAGQGGQTGQETNPIFGAEIGYTPFDSTAISLSAAQGVHTSAADNQQTVVTTSVGVSATQRFFQRLFFNFTFGYTHSDNQSGTGNNAAFADSSQDVLSYRPSFAIAPTAWSSVAIYYQYLDNRSNIASEGYHDNQVGLSVSAQF